MKYLSNVLQVLKEKYLCDWCLGRCFANVLSGYTNKERGRIVRNFVALMLDSGEKLEIKPENLYGIKFRNVEVESKKPSECYVCKNFFDEMLEKVAKKVIEKIEKIEFSTFLIGSVPTPEMKSAEENVWSMIGVEFVEPLNSEINREVGKIIEKTLGKKFSLDKPDVTAIIDLSTNSVRIIIKSIFVYGAYKKLKRGIPQSKWYCSKCKGKGCVECKGVGKLYKTSVQEIIEKPLLAATKSSKSKFSGCGREDIDARCLDWRPFVLELKKPLKRSINLKEIEKLINKSSAVKVRGLKLVDRFVVKKIKTDRLDKTYLAEVVFEKNIDKQSLRKVGSLAGQTITQKTPIRVLHRRADKVRKRLVKSISYRLLSPRKLRLKIRAESGLYIKELITGDEGRTKPNVQELLNNKVKKINLDVIKIHK